jgi:hypothetical protein
MFSFFSDYVTKLPSMVFAASIFSQTIGVSDYGLSERIFKNYQTVGITNIGSAS